MDIITNSTKEALKKYFGFTHFKGRQEEIIQHLLGKNNTFVIMPTGGGKSMCYQLPALGSIKTILPVLELPKIPPLTFRRYMALTASTLLFSTTDSRMSSK